MARAAKKAEPTPQPETAEQVQADQEKAAQERKGMRGHEDGNVRPGDDRYGLHKPEDESKVVRKSVVEPIEEEPTGFNG